MGLDAGRAAARGLRGVRHLHRRAAGVREDGRGGRPPADLDGDVHPCSRRRDADHRRPFAETKEVLGGYYLIDVETIDEALEWAAKIPGAQYGTIEVRPVVTDYETVA